jgi:hypothetical protein
MEVKGTAVAAIRDFVKTNFPENYYDWLNSLPADSKSIFIDLIDPTKWYPLKVAAIIPTRMIGDVIYDGDYIKASVESGKYSAQKALTGIYRIFVKASSTSYIIERASRIFNTYYRPCEMNVIHRTKNLVALHISDMTESDEVIDYRIAGWIQRAMEISGARNVVIKVTESIAKGDEITQMELRWD